ncbi:hypothetical protein [Antarctobacter heliothermus]|uniref:Uncharacterized protein n=1 Tax=Antarctobacter heliothermus TaxID=74033 RepID=A0A239I8I2_9RHOB|nr:hypothetical protein [Antarctobacter heliothermus]SNS89867.1 hypothetical protein SAMN04488078_104035 [Antarctobacter heliothermus]
MIFIIPAVAALIGLTAGWGFLRYGLSGLAWALSALLAILMAWGLYKSQTAQGWDALAYVVLWLLGAAPALLGLGLGALIGRWRRIKAEGIPQVE